MTDAICEYCRGPRPKRNNKFCSANCRSASGTLNLKDGRQSRHGSCQGCGGERHGRGVKYCTPECGYNHRKRVKIERWLLGKDVYCSEYQVPSFIRSYLKEVGGNKCSRCGWAESHPVTGLVPLQIDHIDGDCTNNVRDNLRLLCPNCHSLTENYGVLNRGNSRRKYRHGNANTGYQAGA